MQTKTSDKAMDAARETLCQEFGRLIGEGAMTVRARVLMQNGEPVEVCFYGHQKKGWQLRPLKINERGLAAAIHATLEDLASTEHHDAWSVKQDAASDHHDTDIQFHREELQQLSENELKSRLNGLLFRDSHDSKKDVRRSIRVRRTQ